MRESGGLGGPSDATVRSPDTCACPLCSRGEVQVPQGPRPGRPCVPPFLVVGGAAPSRGAPSPRGAAKGRGHPNNRPATRDTLPGWWSEV